MNSSESRSHPFVLPIPTRLLGWMTLVVALLGIACASILLVFAEKEISPYAATFNRLGFATLIFVVWNSSQRWRSAQLVPTSSRDAVLLSESYVFKGVLVRWPWLATLADIERADIVLLITSGLAFSASLSLWAWSLTQTSVANSTLLNNMMPIFTTVGAWLVFRQTFSRGFLGGMAIAIIGAIVIGLEDFQVNQGLIGDVAALAAALLSAVNILSVKQLRRRFETTVIMMWTSLIGSIFLLIVLLVLRDPIFPTTVMGWGSVLGLAVVSQSLGQGLLTYSLKQFSASLVAVSMLTIPVMAAILAMILFAEHLSLLNCAAFAIVLLGIYLAVSDQQSLPESESADASMVDAKASGG